MALKYYGPQFDVSSAWNERDYRRNFASTTSTSGFPDVPLLPLPYQRNNTTFKALPSSKVNWWRHQAYGPYPGNAPTMSAVADNTLRTSLLNNSTNSAIANLNGNMRESQFSLGVTLVEGRKTIDLITDTSRRITKAYRSVRRGNFAKAADYLFMDPPSRRQQRRMKNEMSRGVKGLTNNWLKYRYGVRPLIGDVYNGIDAVSAIANFDSQDLVYKGFNRDHDTSTYYGADNNISVLKAYTVSARSFDRLQASSSAIGLDNPALVVWELIPFSFMFDWFIPVGTWLEAMKTPSGFSFTSGCESTLIKHRALYSQETGFESGSTWSGWEVVQGASGDYYEDEFTRTVLNSFPTPSSPPSVKSLSKALNLGKAIDAVSILINLSTNRR